jgi:hypothetical protein
VSVETLEIEDRVTPALENIAGGARTAAQSMADLRARLSGLVAEGAQKLVADFGEAAGKTAIMSIQLEAVAQAERAVTSEIQKQIGLEAQIATFDANRVRQTHALQQELAKMHDAALGGPERRAAEAAAKVQSEVAKVQREAQAAAAKGQEEAQAAATKSSGEMGGMIVVAYEAAKQLATALWDAAKAAASVTFEGAKLAVEMSNAKSEAERVFERFTGSKAAADEMYESVKNLSRITGESPEAVAGRMKKLLAEGFKPLLAGNIMQAMADTQAAVGDTEASKLEGIFEKLHNKDALDQKAIAGLARAGVDTKRVYASLASHLHESIDQVKRDLKAGTIAGDEAAAAIAEAVEGKFGGSAQSKADNDILIMLARVKNDARGLFEDIDIGPIKEATKSLFEALEGPGGKELAGGLQDMFGSIFHTLFDPFKGPEGVQKLTNVMHTMAEAAHRVADAARAAAPVVSFLVDVLGRANAAGDNGGPSAIARVADVLFTLFEVMTGLAVFDLDGMMKRITTALGGVGDLVPDLGSVGTRMIDGLVNGIAGGAARVVDSLVSVCTSAVKAAERALGIRSPSTVLAEIGSHTAQGFANGIAANDGAPAAASAAMANGAASAAVSGASRVSAAPASGGEVHINVNTPIVIHANDAKGGEDAAEAAAPMIQQAHREAATSYWRTWKEAG